MQLSGIERTVQMRALIRLLAARSGQLLVASSVGDEAGISQATAPANTAAELGTGSGWRLQIIKS